jgi:TRAP-type mannitol/chloroaromatic compound transport system permease small subunit
MTRLVGWLLWLGVATVIATLLLRHLAGFDAGWLQDLAVWINATALMLGLERALARNAHIRIDIVHERLSRRTRRAVNRAGTAFLLVPAMAMIVWLAVPYAMRSAATLEASAKADGLPGLYLLKMMMALAFVLLLLRALDALRPSHDGGDAGDDRN